MSIIRASGFISSAEKPQPKLRDKSFPVPSGRIAAGGLLVLHYGIVLRKLITLQTVPSPPAISMVSFSSFMKILSSNLNYNYFLVLHQE